MPFYIFKTEVTVEAWNTIEADNEDEAFKRYDELEMEGSIEPETSDVSRFERDYYVVARYDTKEAYDHAESRNNFRVFYKEEEDENED